MGRMAEIDANLHELPDYEKGRLAGIEEERERIILLLENNLYEHEPFIRLIREND